MFKGANVLMSRKLVPLEIFDSPSRLRITEQISFFVVILVTMDLMTST